MGAQLVVQDAAGPQVVPLGGESVTIGREPENGIVLLGQGISRRHCMIEPTQDGGHRLRDLHSTNGVLVNDRRASEIVLQPFDRLRVGETTLVYLEDTADPAEMQRLLLPAELVDTETFGPEDIQPPLRERLLWHLLQIQELRNEDELGPLVEELIADLLDGIHADSAIVLVERRSPHPQLVPLASRNAPEALTKPDAFDLDLAVLRLALDGERVAWGRSPLAPEGTTLCIPLIPPSWAGPERRRGLSLRDPVGAILLGVEGNEPEVQPEDMQLLKALGRQLATTLTSARLRKQAAIDPLTQLCTRGCTEAALEEELSQARRDGSSFGVLLLDVDDFKRVNDTHGHSVGDSVLRAIGDLLVSGLRREDVAGRWGGEEFMIILSGAELKGASKAAKKVVATIGAEPLSDAALPVTVSAGLAVFPLHGQDAGELVRHADRALYAAKAAGKNRCEVYRETIPEPAELTDPGRTAVINRVDLGSSLRLQPVAWLKNGRKNHYPLYMGENFIGRAETCQVVLRNSSVSRRHACITTGPEGIQFEDLGSSNGSYVNELLAEGSVELTFGDELDIGPHTLELCEQGQEGDDTSLWLPQPTERVPRKR